MKSRIAIAIIIILLISILFAVTTPSREAHAAKIRIVFQKQLKNSTAADDSESQPGDPFLTQLKRAASKIKSALQSGILDVQIDSVLQDMDYGNYVLFSITRTDGELLSFGILNQVIVSKDVVSRKMESFF